MEKDFVQSASHPTFPSIDEDTWRSAVAKAEQSLEETINGLRFSAINTASALPPPAPDNQTKSLPPFGILEVALPTPLTPALRKPLLATQASGWKINPPDLSMLLEWHSDSNAPFARLSVEPTEPDFERSLYLTYLGEQPDARVSGAIYLPLAHLSHWQTGSPDWRALHELTHQTSDLINLTTITVRGDEFEQWGASASDELALTLSWWVAYCDQLTDLGLPIETILARTELSLSTDADYFVGLAKFRAVRYLINKIAQAYGVAEDTEARPRVRAVSGLRNKTYYDPDTNLLRNTTDALASLLGGVDTLSLAPHDFLGASPDPFGIRMVSNTYHILCHEAQLGKVTDPAAGSY
ncbi:MAG: methylmalonyl-CoA mutase family protein, partial [Tunicatimonas sp.]